MDATECWLLSFCFDIFNIRCRAGFFISLGSSGKKSGVDGPRGDYYFLFYIVYGLSICTQKRRVEVGVNTLLKHAGMLEFICVLRKGEISDCLIYFSK